MSKSRIGKGIGKKHSDETRLKMSAARKMRVISKESAKKNGLAHKKPVMNINTREIFNSAKDAEIAFKSLFKRRDILVPALIANFAKYEAKNAK